MKALLVQKHFLQSLQQLRHVIIPMRNSFAFSNYLIVIAEEKTQTLSFVLTCNTAVARSEVTAKVEGTAVFFLPLATIYELVKSFNENDIIEILQDRYDSCTISAQYNISHIICRDLLYNPMYAIHPHVIQKSDKERQEKLFVVPEREFKRALQDTLPFVAHQASNRLFWLCLCLQRSRSNAIEIVASNNNTIAQISLPYKNMISGQLLVPGATLEPFASLLSDSDELLPQDTIECYFDATGTRGKSILFHASRLDLDFIVNIYGDDYPSIEHIYPNQDTYEVILHLNTAEFLKAVQRNSVLVLHEKEEERCLTLSVDANNFLHVLTHMTDEGYGHSLLPCSIEKTIPDFTVKVDVEGLITILQSIDSDTVIMRAHVGTSVALIFLPEKRSTRFALISPY